MLPRGMRSPRSSHVNKRFVEGLCFPPVSPVPSVVKLFACTITAVTVLQLTITHRLSSLRIKGKNLVAVKTIKLGQVWRQDASGQDYLVTKVYNEVFTQYAVLRLAEVTAPDAPVVKVKVAKSADGVSLPGFSFTQEGAF